jgi:multiple sugar transport system permease protein
MNLGTQTGDSNRVVPQRIQHKVVKAFAILAALAASIFIFIPLYVMVAVAVQPSEVVFGGQQVDIIIRSLSLENFQSVVNNTAFATYFINSMLVTGATVLLSTLLSISAGYGLTRFDFRGKSYFARLILFSYMFSPIILALPLYVLFSLVGALDTYFALVLGITAIATPFGIWLMWQYFQTIPVSIEESAWVRGVSRWRTVIEVVIPIARPGIISTGIFSFAVAWNDFTISRVILSENKMYTLPVGLNLFLDDVSLGFGEMMATALLVCIPPFIVALTLQKYLIRGFNVGNL